MGSFVAYLGRNRAAKRKIWECFQQNYDAIMLRFKGKYVTTSFPPLLRFFFEG